MKKTLTLVALVGLTTLAACIPYTPYIIESVGPPLSDFSAITVKVDATRFLETKVGNKHYDGYVKACKQMNEMVTSRVQTYLDKNFHGKTGGPAAILTITVDDFVTGSGAARLFMSIGGVESHGHLNVSETITGGHSFTTHADITGIGISEINAYNDIASFTNAYLKNHLTND